MLKRGDLVAGLVYRLSEHGFGESVEAVGPLVDIDELVDLSKQPNGLKYCILNRGLYQWCRGSAVLVKSAEK